MRKTLRTLPSAERWLESLPAPVLGVNEEGRVNFVNAAAADLLAGAARGLAGRRLEDVFGPDTPLSGLCRRARARAADVIDTDIVLSGPGYSLGRMSVSVANVGDDGCVALVFTRPAHQRTASPASPNTAVRTLAHEVRNPLAGIRAAAQLIARTEDQEQAALAKLICDEVDRIHRLTDSIDPMGAFEPPRFARFNVHEALNRVRQLIGSGAPSITLSERYDPSLPHVRGDQDQLIQAFLNVAKNAAEAVGAQDDGRITFITAFRPGVKYRAAANAAPRAQLEVRIEDNGPGLHPEVADRLFEPFATTKPGGMGLGLTVAAEIIARHEGRIETESAAGATVFKILLPIEPDDIA